MLERWGVVDRGVEGFAHAMADEEVDSWDVEEDELEEFGDVEKFVG